MQGPLYNLPGPAALRGHLERNSTSYSRVAPRLKTRTVRAHAQGEYAPSHTLVAVYHRYLKIPPSAWSTAPELSAFGLDAAGQISEGP